MLYSLVFLDTLQHTNGTLDSRIDELLRVLGVHVQGRGCVCDCIDAPNRFVESILGTDIFNDDVLERLALKQLRQVVTLLVRANGSTDFIPAFKQVFDSLPGVRELTTRGTNVTYTAMYPLAPVTRTKAPLAIAGMISITQPGS